MNGSLEERLLPSEVLTLVNLVALEVVHTQALVRLYEVKDPKGLIANADSYNAAVRERDALVFLHAKLMSYVPPLESSYNEVEGGGQYGVA